MNNIQIELTKDEADVILSLLGSIGGPPESTFRKHANSAYEKIKRPGLDQLAVEVKGILKVHQDEPWKLQVKQLPFYEL